MTEAKLRQMLQSGFTQESSFVERKPDHFKDREARKTVVAFANSTPEGQESVLFIGVDDTTGSILGVSDPDTTQRKYSQVLEECYPPIRCQMHAITLAEGTVVAIVVPASPLKPHFSGPAYIRDGSRTVKANDEQYRELIVSRVGKAAVLLRYKRDHTLIAVRGVHYRLGSLKPLTGGGHVEEIPDCKIEACDGITVTVLALNSRTSFSESLERVTIEFDAIRNRPLLLVTAPGRRVSNRD
jgi:hypothetical protein